MKTKTYTDGQKLRLIRNNMMWGQTRMAAYLNIHTTLLSHYERGRRIVPNDTMIKARKLIDKIGHTFDI